MIDFQPSGYRRLIKRNSSIARGVIEFHLSVDGLEDPNCTIVPIMEEGYPPAVVYLEFNGKVYLGSVSKWGYSGSMVLEVKL